MAPRSRNIAMEFACCPAICDAIKARVDKRIFGYTMMFDDAYYKALNGWCGKRYGWSFRQEDLCFSPGIIPALYQLVEDLIGEGETFVITTPSYGVNTVSVTGEGTTTFVYREGRL